MTLNNKNTLSSQIINKALDFGACLAGIANIVELKKSPSHLISEKLTEFGGVGTKQVKGKKQGEIHWPENDRSAVVIAIEHPLGAQDMDWWLKGSKGGTKGNIKLIAVFSKLADWLEKEKKIPYIKLAYHIEHGAVFMKDAAVLGGLGCIGKNNMLVTPRFGPRIRLRVMLLDEDLPSTGILDFDPCTDCKEYCRKACPQKAFNTKIYSAREYGQNELPGRSGVYSRIKCNIQMEKNAEKGRDVDIEGSDKKGLEIRYCRICEMSCPVGRSS
ncbi:MAG: epoxyqueuosine reductase [Deltaproteobacteria bacterium]|uniref:epoxyqueuosine reductase n=1 Tax=Desulfobacula sp. TaxID=2593537 RepID=UPI0019851E2D|nr:epoxyqueuosine reductase [Candidatus Desulfobacula maris]MBL6992603.1 epoxyqueuosine reductase [Desulfobacula sp.]